MEETKQITFFEPISGFAIGTAVPFFFKSKNPIVYICSMCIGASLGLLLSYKKAENELKKS
jgi:uncharacterized membrane protein YqgA involved in biofilm formation